jgi:hypothetical protein
MQNYLMQLLAALSLILPPLVQAEPDAPAHVYENSLIQARKLGSALYQTLDEKYRKSIRPDPIQVEPIGAPVILPCESDDGHKSLRAVKISVGFIDLVNHIAHAKAIDRIQPGYFDRYILSLSQSADPNVLPPPPDMIDDRYWTMEVMNDQAGYFNQIIGLTLALNLSHHYLGHYNKFSKQMPADKPTPINLLLTPAEWEASVKAATLNSLNCALGTAGPKALLEAIDKMPARPGWTAFIVPPSTDLKNLSEQLKKYEDQYFHGGIK